MRNVVLMGPPGGGKGTQAEKLVETHGLVHLSTGEILRAAVRSFDELGSKVEAILAAGELVPDELMMDVLRDALAAVPADSAGWLLDGFPRTAPQAEGLIGVLESAGLEAPLVIEITVPDEEIVSRLSGRLTCNSCSHVTGRGETTEGDDCNRCSDGKLYMRTDDKPETVRNRLAVFREKTEPAKAVLAASWNLVGVDGLGSPDEVTERIAGVLEA